MTGRIRDEKAPSACPSDLLEVREWQVEQAEGASSLQVKEDVKRLRREPLLLAKSYGWSYGH